MAVGYHAIVKRTSSSREALPFGQLSLWSSDRSGESWHVRVSGRARRMSIRVLAGGCVEIVVPPWMRARAIQQFVHRHRNWVEQKVSEFRFLAPATVGALPDRIELGACGEVWQVRRAGHVRGALVEHSAGMNSAGMSLEVTSDTRRIAEVQRQLRRWLIARARCALLPWIERLSAQTGLSFESLQIRRQRTRWGSCSPGGTISLNCCLLFQPAAVVRYLLLHELCHTRHMNHSRRFWRLVARHEPDYRALDRALTRGWQNVPGWVWEPT